MSIEWTDNNVDWLKRLWAEGWSREAIAEIMGKTANAIGGKADRIHLPKRPTRRHWGKTIAAKADSSPVNAFIKSGAPDKPLPAFARPEALEAIAGISFLEMADANGKVCKWAKNDAAPWIFCGQPSMEHKPYCEFHYRRAYHAIGGTR